MKIFSAEQIRQLDAYTIENEPIASIDLMERASTVFTSWFTEKFPDEDQPVLLFCGIGNNGGDGLAVARMLHQHFYDVTVYWCKISENSSQDFKVNYGRLPRHKGVTVVEIENEDPMPELISGAIVIDAIFGSGLNRPVEGYWARLVEYLNEVAKTIVAIDIPSGLFADQPTNSISIQADSTLSFQLPKLAFFFPENHPSVGEWEVRPIGLHPVFIENTEARHHYVDEAMVRRLIRRRGKFDHKGNFGHALLIMGSYGKVGAAVLAGRACLRSGAGLVSIHAPRCAYEILQGSFPEAMVSVDRHKHFLSEIPPVDTYRAIGVGCGLDQKEPTAEALLQLLDKSNQPLVIDADGLNILSRNKKYYKKIPKNSILTPHPKEFERLFGKTGNEFERHELQKEKAKELGLYIVLKGGNTCIAAPDGTSYFNSTGNPGMATAGSGDVLTGILTGLLAQGYTPLEACLLGVYLHGLAGDLAVQELGQEAMIAGDLTEYLGKAFGQVK